jgi:hypothetical protein
MQQVFAIPVQTVENRPYNSECKRKVRNILRPPLRALAGMAGQPPQRLKRSGRTLTGKAVAWELSFFAIDPLDSARKKITCA